MTWPGRWGPATDPGHESLSPSCRSLRLQTRSPGTSRLRRSRSVTGYDVHQVATACTVKVGSANGTSCPVTGVERGHSVHLRGDRPRRGGQRVRGLTRRDRADPAGRPDRRLVGYAANIGRAASPRPRLSRTPAPPRSPSAARNQTSHGYCLLTREPRLAMDHGGVTRRRLHLRWAYQPITTASFRRLSGPVVCDRAAESAPPSLDVDDPGCLAAWNQAMRANSGLCCLIAGDQSSSASAR